MLKIPENIPAAVQRVLTLWLAAVLMLTGSADAIADEAYAKQRLKEMSDYLATEMAISFEFDAVLGMIASDGQTLELVSSGAVVLNRPDKIHATRSGGFIDVETIFDGSTLTILGKNANVYTQIESPGTVDELVDLLTHKYDRPLPAGDLLLTDSFSALMADVSTIRDLGSGVVNGSECDYFAVRAEEVDWQIWVAQGDSPYPCRFVINSRQMEGNPHYSIQTRKWKTGDQASKSDFGFNNESNASKVDIEDLQSTVLPENFKMGE